MCVCARICTYVRVCFYVCVGQSVFHCVYAYVNVFFGGRTSFSYPLAVLLCVCVCLSVF